MWIFGYGSLVWRPEMEYEERRAAFIDGWSRRFWQGSTDHRGVPDAPGRVVTLIPHPTERCWGMAYRISDEVRDEVLLRLDFREKGGYQQRRVHVRFSEVGAGVQGMVYIATPANPNYLGPAPLADIARQVRASSGPSGHNVEYVQRLAASLEAIGARDEHVAALARLLADGCLLV